MGLWSLSKDGTLAELTIRDQHNLNTLKLGYKRASIDLVFMLRQTSVPILRRYS
jgi:hypothetical protein